MLEKVRISRWFVLLVFFAWISATMMTPAIAGEIDFPVRVSGDRRHLEDASGRPFLITGDSAWSLIADPSREDVGFYLKDRQARGFNTLLVSMIEHKFARNAPDNFYGVRPFLVSGDFSKPNDRYFDHAEWVLDEALKRGFLVFLTPAYAGVDGGSEGWYQEMVAAGPQALREYGRYLGRRFGKFPNIVWTQGGDYDPPDRRLVEAIAGGIAETAPGALQTAHTGPDSISSNYWNGSPWLAIDTIYTYKDTASTVFAHFNAEPKRPFFLIEARYENGESHGGQAIRKIAYGALLSGASGQMYGNEVVWHFNGPGLTHAMLTWKEALSSTGTQSIGYLANLFNSIDWWSLEPDQGQVLIDVSGQDARAVAAGAKDGSLFVAYLENAQNVTLGYPASTANDRVIRWYDPSSGVFSEAVPQIEGKDRLQIPIPNEQNHVGEHDWVLVVSDKSP